ncbi:MAG TPA: ornithine cyclodeaminase family protein [Burkholderiales bacterium]|nr:ornithine cyclodeaminase family protein [Burkholderiales bacterium]
MIHYLTEQDVQQVLNMEILLESTERSLRDRALHQAIDIPRQRIYTPEGTQHVLQASSRAIGYTGFKYYYTRPTGKSFYVHLISIQTGKLEAIVEAIWMSMVRTGAASGAATKYLAKEDASIVGQIGSGYQSIGQLEAVCAVRKIKEARVFSRTRDKLEAYCKRMTEKLGVPVLPAASAEAAVRGADILNVITKSATPTIKGEWLTPGVHINAAGSNALSRAEIDDATVKRCDTITVDSRGTAQKECGDLVSSFEKGVIQWEYLAEIGDVYAGKAPGRTSPTQITLYESHGMGIQDLYGAAKALELAKARGIGTPLPVGL